MGGDAAYRGRARANTGGSVSALLRSKDLNDRRRGIALSRAKLDPEARRLLLNIAMNDPVPGIASEAAHVLGRAQDETLLRELLQHPSAFQGEQFVGRRRHVCNAAALMTTQRAFEVLRSLAHDPDVEVRETAYLGLGRFSSRQALDVLLSRKGKERDSAASAALSEAVRRWKRRQAQGVSGHP